ncbi:hypothetical protein KCP77_16410 [Salmonella enterica subsp. enterica]|nr:hypothetical protein KCP77_16410 [Salmonella enterica subsp. enterica]
MEAFVDRSSGEGGKHWNISLFRWSLITLFPGTNSQRCGMWCKKGDVVGMLSRKPPAWDQRYSAYAVGSAIGHIHMLLPTFARAFSLLVRIYGATVCCPRDMRN